MYRIEFKLTQTIDAGNSTTYVYSTADGSQLIQLGWHPTQEWVITIPCTKGIDAKLARKLVADWENKSVDAKGDVVQSLEVA